MQSEQKLLQTDSGSVTAELKSREIESLPLGNYRNYQSLLNLVPGTTPARVPERGDRHAGARADHKRQRHRPEQQQHAARRHDERLHLAAAPRGLRGACGDGGHGEHLHEQLRRRAGDGGRRGGHACSPSPAPTSSTAPRSRCTRTRGSAPGTSSTRATRSTARATSTAPRWAGRSSRTSCSSSWAGRGRTRRRRNTRTGTVPTAAMRAGDFSAFGHDDLRPRHRQRRRHGPHSRSRATSDPRRTGSARSRATSRAGCPCPTCPALSGNYTGTGPIDLTRNNFDFKLNFNISSSAPDLGEVQPDERHGGVRHVAGQSPGRRGGSATASATARASATPRSSSAPSATPGRYRRSSCWTGPSALTRFDQECVPPDVGTNFGTDVFGIPGTNGDGLSGGDPRTSGMPQLLRRPATSTTAASTAGARSTATTGATTSPRNLTWIRNKHDLRFGVDVVKLELNHWQPELGAGPARRASTSTAGRPPWGPPAHPNQFNAYAQFLLGLDDLDAKGRPVRD